ncbi:transcriptional regulator with XRE-family HTH domain [Sphingobium sp. B1D7B]|uniref:helix-turn-helix domain-containing protein n=1 Tax=unclassified Sphingobium TaxID=2611147 RepID=UPI002224E130|nr:MULTISPECIES: helix-turn-helix transcriptional regulator [unclassified Sphingobium]MCW2370176.1 transcriptional regulator with XRE-family HTH domain [Sphingobium sp. B11D3D]MCW2395155.1 transcriptional regulator with XRE-family HTH domain [Sphingobium sp. B8D3B]MCW2405286.1 transcriptional regulator with XRE-family HTH domain [Sphingobium sp. B1D7B]MCW2418669.1 transcriptional regulator with XRE-family HTH domain [Sphingobium sp. B8D3C]
MDLGRRLSDRINDVGLSQAELARRIGIKQPSINYLISRGPQGSKHLLKIARELQTTPEYLLGETDDPQGSAPDNVLADAETREMAERFKRLGGRDRRALLQIARSLDGG